MNTNELKLLKNLFFCFFKIGLFTFGGGYAMIPLIEKEMVENEKCITSEEMTDILAVSQSFPGAIAINAATFIGFKRCGKIGAITATLGVIMPSFIIIALIASFFSTLNNNHFLESVFFGIRPAVVALIVYAVFKIGKSSIKDITGLIVAVIALTLVMTFNLHAIFIIIGSAFFGLAVYIFRPEKAKEILKNGDKKK